MYRLDLLQWMCTTRSRRRRLVDVHLVRRQAWELSVGRRAWDGCLRCSLLWSRLISRECCLQRRYLRLILFGVSSLRALWCCTAKSWSLANEPGFALHLWRCLVLDLLLRLLKLRRVLLQPVNGNVRQIRSSDSSVDHGHHRRRYTSLQRLSQHRLLDASLIEAQYFLLSLLLLLLSLVLLCFSDEPMAH